MARTMDNGGAARWLRPLAWSAAVALVLAPLVAMQFTREVNWTASDFLFAAVLVGGVGLAFEAVVRVSRDRAYRAGAALTLCACFFLTWSNLAVGYIGSEDNPYNLWFFGVVAIVLLGAMLSGLRPRGMALTAAAAGVAHAVIGAVGFAQDTRTGPITLVFVAVWLGSARLFQIAARGAA